MYQRKQYYSERPQYADAPDNTLEVWHDPDYSAPCNIDPESDYSINTVAPMFSLKQLHDGQSFDSPMHGTPRLADEDETFLL